MQVTERRRVRAEAGTVKVDEQTIAQRAEEERKKAERQQRAAVTAARMTDPRKGNETWGYV